MGSPCQCPSSRLSTDLKDFSAVFISCPSQQQAAEPPFSLSEQCTLHTYVKKKKNYQGLKVNQRQKFMLWWQWVLRRRSENRNPSVKYQVSTKRCGNSLTNQSLTSSSCLFQIFHFYGREIKKLRGKSSGMHKLSAYRNGLKSPGAICDHIPPFK